MSFQRRKTMKKRILKSDRSGTELELTINDHTVVAVFPASPQPEIYKRVKRIMSSTLSRGLPCK